MSCIESAIDCLKNEGDDLMEKKPYDIFTELLNGLPEADIHKHILSEDLKFVEETTGQDRRYYLTSTPIQKTKGVRIMQMTLTSFTALLNLFVNPGNWALFEGIKYFNERALECFFDDALWNAA